MSRQSLRPRMKCFSNVLTERPSRSDISLYDSSSTTRSVNVSRQRSGRRVERLTAGLEIFVEDHLFFGGRRVVRRFGDRRRGIGDDDCADCAND